MESRRLPGAGAGPSPDRMVMGSEGTLGIITEAWTRLHARPTHRAAASVRFEDFYVAAEAVRAVAQAGLYPANCRLIDGNETRMSGASPEGESLMVLSFESADHPVDHWLERALECCADLGGGAEREANEDARRAGQAGRWRNYFIRAPYYREFFTARGILNETFETAITWKRFPEFHATVMRETAKAIRDVTGMDGFLSCRFTHVYPDGPAPYFTWRTLGRKEVLIEQYDEIKAATAEVVYRMGGTVTHHHAVGRLHRPWYDKQRPDLFAAAYGAAKRQLDPRGIMNPGVLLDTERSAAAGFATRRRSLSRTAFRRNIRGA
jgi:alkyldihydroxyacetonephosphate synthase